MFNRSTEFKEIIIRAEELAPQAKDLSKEIMEWMKTHDFKLDAVNKPEMANYFNNLDIISKSSTVKLKNINFVGGILISYLIEKDKIRKKQEQDSKKPSEYVGQVGGKINNIIVTLLFQRNFESQYGFGTIYNFEDEQGNRLTWFSSKDIGLTDKTKYKILNGTVKAQQENTYGKYKETIITRVKLESLDSNKINKLVSDSIIEYTDFYK